MHKPIDEFQLNTRVQVQNSRKTHFTPMIGCRCLGGRAGPGGGTGTGNFPQAGKGTLEKCAAILARSCVHRRSRFNRESIHAVESLCQILTGEPNYSLGKALNKLKGKISIPEELEQALHKLYGFTSNADGVRHAFFDEPNLSLREARFMLVTCSAFVTYLRDAAIAAGLQI
jgi:hypothetical protein